MLAEAAREYLDFWWSTNGSWSSLLQAIIEERALSQKLCFTTWSLIEHHVGSHPDFPSQGWLDGFLPDQITVTGPDSLEMPGLVVWVIGQESWWLDPGFVSIELESQTTSLGRYSLRFGDAATGLATRPYSRRRAEIWQAPKAWLFAFDYSRHTIQ